MQIRAFFRASGANAASFILTLSLLALAACNAPASVEKAPLGTETSSTAGTPAASPPGTASGSFSFAAALGAIFDPAARVAEAAPALAPAVAAARAETARIAAAKAAEAAAAQPGTTVATPGATAPTTPDQTAAGTLAPATPGSTAGSPDAQPADQTTQAASAAPAIPTWRISYQANGATSGTPPADSRPYEADAAVSVAAPGSLDRAHFTFAGWNTAADGRGTAYAPGASFRMPTAPVTLYAQWNAKPNWGISYAATTAQSGSAPADTKRYETGDRITLADNSGKLQRSGYVFAGWTTQADGRGPALRPGSTLTMESADIALYPRWDMDTVAVPGGTFRRSPVITDTTTVAAFRIGRYEVTAAQFAELSGLPDPNNFSEVANGPANRISWYAALVFCNRLSLAEGRTPVYRLNNSTDPAVWGAVPTANSPAWNAVQADFAADGYRLPTESEWQWAAMGATDKANRDFAGSTGSNSAADYAWYKDTAGGTVHPIGRLKPNELGLYDLCGNVAEWCWDWFAEMPDGPKSDWRGPASGTYRCLRGGSWNYNAATIAVNYRNSYNQNFRDPNIGFRVVRR